MTRTSSESSSQAFEEEKTLDEKLQANLPQHLQPYLDYEGGHQITDRTLKNLYLSEFSFLEKGVFKDSRTLQDICISALKLIYDQDDIVARKDYRERSLMGQSREYIRNAERSLTRLQHEHEQMLTNHQELTTWLDCADQKLLFYDAQCEALRQYGLCKKEGTPPSQELLRTLGENLLSQKEFSATIEIKKLQYEKDRFSLTYDRMVTEYVRLTQQLENKENEITARRNQVLTADWSMTQKQKALSGVVSSGILKTLVEQVDQAKVEEGHAATIGKSQEITRRFHEDMQDGLELLARPFKSAQGDLPARYGQRLDDISLDIDKRAESMRSVAKEIRSRMYGT